MNNIIKLSENNLTSTAKTASWIIKSGGIIIAPFDTVYGFACYPGNDQTIEKIFTLKGRDLKKTIGTALSDIEMLNSFAIANEFNIKFIKERTPGKFTFIMKAKNFVLSKYCYQDETIGVRIPDSDLILQIAQESGGVIAQTSANKAGEHNCFSLDDLKAQFSEDELSQIDLIIDGGTIESGEASEIWDLTGKKPVKAKRK
ncbi:MAG: L-threonylcarbamoyladenylate synthase [Patescibacteria group bacterium]